MNQSFVIDGQRITAESVEIYPTHIRFNIFDDPNNTAWIKGISFYMEDENGNRFDKIKSGITATGSPDTPNMVSYRLESPFFSKSKSFTIYVTEAVLLNKDMERIKVILPEAEAERLPQGVSFRKACKTGNIWVVGFTGTERSEYTAYQLFESHYYDELGNEYRLNSWNTYTGNFFDEEQGRSVETPEEFSVEFSLSGYPYDTVYLCPAFSHYAQAEEVIVIKVK